MYVTCRLKTDEESQHYSTVCCSLGCNKTSLGAARTLSCIALASENDEQRKGAIDKATKVYH